MTKKIDTKKRVKTFMLLKSMHHMKPLALIENIKNNKKKNLKYN